MDIFTRLKKRAGGLIPDTEEYENFISGLATSISCSYEDMEKVMAKHINTEIELDNTNREEVIDLGLDVLLKAHEEYDFNEEETIEFIYILLYNTYFSLYEVQNRFTTAADLRKALDNIHSTMYKEYIKLFDIDEAIKHNNKPNNIIQFKKRNT